MVWTAAQIVSDTVHAYAAGDWIVHKEIYEGGAADKEGVAMAYS
jgi:hypothetical protein